MRRTWCPVSTLNSDVFASYLQTLSSFRPDVIIAYPTPLSMFAEFLLGRPENIHRPKSIITTAEATTDTQRSLIEQAFGCKVFSHYGARDFGMIAAECETAHATHLCDVTT